MPNVCYSYNVENVVIFIKSGLFLTEGTTGAVFLNVQARLSYIASRYTAFLAIDYIDTLVWIVYSMSHLCLTCQTLNPKGIVEY